MIVSKSVSINSTSYKRSDGAISFLNVQPTEATPSSRVSINSTSYKRSDQHDPHSYNRIIVTFPLIPLPIKEAII